MKTITNIRYSAIAIFAFACFVLSPAAQGVNPAPDGGYQGGNTAEGQSALLSLTTGGFNTAVGFWSLRSNTAGNFNTAVGAGTLLANTSDENTATGAGALLSNTIGEGNAAHGVFALSNNTTGSNNTANGSFALFSNTEGAGNTAVGALALRNNATGVGNTAAGVNALSSNTTGDSNTATGAGALLSNTTGANNTAAGEYALSANSTGGSNTAMGLSALINNTNGNNNVAVGYNAGQSQTTGSNNVYIGAGLVGVAGESNARYIGSIFGQTSGGGAQVLINATGKLGTATSSKRFKEDIEPMDKASEALLALKPVTFRYKMEMDRGRTRQFGLVAEDVEKVNPDLVMRDKEGRSYSVRYDQVNAMLLNEFLKEHRKVEEQGRELHQQQATISELKLTVSEQQRGFQAKLAEQEKQIKALASDFQRVSMKIEVSKPTQQMAVNHH